MGSRAGGKEEHEILLSRDPTQAYLCAEMLPQAHGRGAALFSFHPAHCQARKKCSVQMVNVHALLEIKLQIHQ